MGKVIEINMSYEGYMTALTMIQTDLQHRGELTEFYEMALAIAKTYPYPDTGMSKIIAKDMILNNVEE